MYACWLCRYRDQPGSNALNPVFAEIYGMYGTYGSYLCRAAIEKNSSVDYYYNLWTSTFKSLSLYFTNCHVSGGGGWRGRVQKPRVLAHRPSSTERNAHRAR
jgi:hypothetical protein